MPISFNNTTPISIDDVKHGSFVEFDYHGNNSRHIVALVVKSRHLKNDFIFISLIDDGIWTDISDKHLKEIIAGQNPLISNFTLVESGTTFTYHAPDPQLPGSE